MSDIPKLPLPFHNRKQFDFSVKEASNGWILLWKTEEFIFKSPEKLAKKITELLNYNKPVVQKWMQ